MMECYIKCVALVLSRRRSCGLGLAVYSLAFKYYGSFDGLSTQANIARERQSIWDILSIELGDNGI